MIRSAFGRVWRPEVRMIDDRYELADVVASGGMATVWRALDTRLDRLVAVKRPHPGLADGDDAERMDREARAAAALRHPNLVTVHDYGSDDDGPYLVMELVEGPTLRELSGSIAVDEVVGIGASLADALSAIHEAGIVHRDVKPANVIMAAHGPLLTDFGIALDRDLTGDLTDPGRVVATPSYAAPEVLRGERPTPAADVYSLAVVVDELIGKAGSEPDPHVREALDAALADSPDDRPDAASLARSLRGAAPTVGAPLPDDSTLILDPADPDTPEDPSSRKRVLVLWGFGVALLVLALLAVLALGGDETGADTVAEPPAVSSTVTTAATTTPTTAANSTSSTPAVDDEVSETRGAIESILLEPPRSDLKPKEVDDIMKKVDEAILRAREGDDDEAAKNLSEAAERIAKKVEEERADEALAAVDRLADLLELEDFEARDDSDD